MSEKKPQTLPQLMFPELLLFERKGESGPAWERAFPILTSTGLGGTIICCAGIVLASRLSKHAVAIIRELAPSLPPIVLDLASMVVLGGSASGLVWASLWLLRGRIRRSLRLSLVASGVPVCLHCCYDVRGQIEPRCPECGREFDPKLRDLWEYLRAKQPDASAEFGHEAGQPHVTVTDARPSGAARE